LSKTRYLSPQALLHQVAQQDLAGALQARLPGLHRDPVGVGEPQRKATTTTDRQEVIMSANSTLAPACPVWCELDAGHEPGRGDRVHCRTVATLQRDDRQVATVAIAAIGRIPSDEATEVVEAAAVDLFVNEDLVEDMTADQARHLATFLSESLASAALQLEQIRALP
jgi:hypothetical protein